ncbi:MAG: serine hydrolase domain-containing protein [Acidimicrobiia bacterium]
MATSSTSSTVARRAVVALVTVGMPLLLAAACSGDDDGSPRRSEGAQPSSNPSSAPTSATNASSVPGAEWETVAPAAVGLDAEKLGEIAERAEEGKSRCLVVVRDGKLAGEWYFRGTGPETAQNVFSVTKSVSSTLVGIAQDDGDLRIADRVATWIPEWQDTPSDAVTVRNLLSNDSGREWSLAIDYVQLLRAPDRTAFAVGLGQAEPPGTVWAYNSSAIQTLQPVVQESIGEDVTVFARDRLFEPLGMRNTEMTTDASGRAQMFQGLRSTCRDLARFGTLFLERGSWGSERVVSADWVDAATGGSSTELNAAYGYLWWLNREGVLAGPLAATSIAGAADPTTTRGRLVPGAPASMFWALGLGNQIVQVDPASRTVVVRLGTAEARPQPPTFGPAEASRVVTEAVTGPVP